MNKKTEMELTEGSTYKIISLGSRDSALESKGVFKGFISIGIDEIGLIMKLDKSHGEMKGKIRIIPLHVILAIDVYDVKPNDKEDKEKEMPRYVG
jgi:hypothetical protein